MNGGATGSARPSLYHSLSFVLAKTTQSGDGGRDAGGAATIGSRSSTVVSRPKDSLYMAVVDRRGVTAVPRACNVT